MRLAAALCLAAAPALAGVPEAVDEILPRLDTFAAATAQLADAAQQDCRPSALEYPYTLAFDAWMPLADIRLGPSEGGNLSIAFWPDAKGATQRMLSRLIDEADPVIGDPVGFTQVSIAVRGLFALDQLLFDPRFADYQPGSYSCALAQTITADLALQAAMLRDNWSGYTSLLLNPGSEGNTAYLDETEAFKAIYTQILSGLEFDADTRLGRPMGTVERPRPTRAEAWRSDRPIRNIEISIRATVALAEALAGAPLPQTRDAADRALEAAGKIGDRTLQDLDDPTARFRAEVLQTRIRDMKDAIELEVGVPRGIQPGFNAQDGD